VRRPKEQVLDQSRTHYNVMRQKRDLIEVWCIACCARRPLDTRSKRVEVPADHLWGAHTERSHRNFPLGVDSAPPAVIFSLWPTGGVEKFIG